jgi:hypothetical protein
MHYNTFYKLGRSEKRMFGPPCIIICGYRYDEQEKILSLINSCGLSGYPVVFAREGDADITLKDIVKTKSQIGQGFSSGLIRAIIMSGFTEKKLHVLMSNYRKEKFAPQLWATVTQISQNWTLKTLLKEISLEAEALKSRQPR